MTWHLRYRTDATGHVAQWAGRVMYFGFDSAEDAEEVRRACPNGAQMEVVADRARIREAS